MGLGGLVMAIRGNFAAYSGRVRKNFYILALKGNAGTEWRGGAG